MPFKWEKDYSFDYRLGYVRKGGEWPGITVIQPKSADTYADIFILGGYTTPGEIEKKISWPHKLFDLLKKSGVSARLFVGDTDGYVSFQEMLLLIRDVLLMKPSLVITLSGYNNFRNAAGLGIREDEAETLRRHPFLGQRQLRVVRDVASVAFDPWKESLYLGMGGGGAPPRECWVRHWDWMNKKGKEAG
ncbi:MAG: hypothetical protein FWF05_05490 [Oscillospiraceae bacterium]|nr:hypothetical protein [Oscillospiraceae bacterium]